MATNWSKSFHLANLATYGTFFVTISNLDTLLMPYSRTCAYSRSLIGTLIGTLFAISLSPLPIHSLLFFTQRCFHAARSGENVVALTKLARMKGSVLIRRLISRDKQVVPRRYLSSTTMAKSKFEYVKEFEQDDNCLPNCWIVIRIDGRNFSRFCETHQFVKPNDVAALELMNRAAITVMEDFKEIILGFGQSDEYSFVFRKDTELYKRRASKLLSNVNSLFASAYVYYWPRIFRGKELYYPPSFDARIVLYPTDKNLRDYLAWRQADVHVNNLYNTCFWNLILKGKLTPSQAEEKLRGTLASHKNELLFQEFGINYNNEPQLFRKGTTLIRKLVPDGTGRLKPAVVPLVDDIIGDRFWKENPEVIGLKSLTTYQPPNLANSIKNTISMPTPPSPTTIKHGNNVSPQVINVNSMKEEVDPNKNRETEGDRMQCESEHICRR